MLESDGFEIDESALTGEADAIAKDAGAEVRSGSVVVGGTGVVRATAVGEDAWIHQLLTQAKEFGMATSELRRGVDRILSVVSWIIVPIAALLLWSQLRDDADVQEGLVSAVAGVVGLVPQGLVLLVSAALAVAVVRLAREQVVIQELHAVEGLARIDVFCVDKTGTLTTGEMHLDRIELLGTPTGGQDDAAAAAEDEVRLALAALAANESAPTATLTAAAGDTQAPDWPCVEHVPFNSARKWSGATFEPGGSWIVGAPEVLLGDGHPGVRDRLGELTEDARRVVLVARSDSVLDRDGAAPADLTPVALVVIASSAAMPPTPCATSPTKG